jgi:hypothetical protein
VPTTTVNNQYISERIFLCLAITHSEQESTNKRKKGTIRRLNGYVYTGSLVAAALAGESLWEPPPVRAVVVAHVVAFSPGNGAPLGRARLLFHPLVAAGRARAAADAGVGGVALVQDGERRVGPVDGDLALLRGPVAAVPERGVHRHALGVGVGEVGVVLEAADDVVVHLEDNVLRIPDDGVGVVVGGRVEPEVELVLLLAVAVGPHVGVEHHRLTAGVAHELHVDLVAVVIVPGGELRYAFKKVGTFSHVRSIEEKET